MNISSISFPQEQAREALLAYKQHRSTYDARDWETVRNME